MIRRIADINNGFPVPTRLGFKQVYSSNTFIYATFVQLGGYVYAVPYNNLTSVTRSVDGITWTDQTVSLSGAPGPFGAVRGDSTSTKMMICGNYNPGASATAGVMSSTNGLNWTNVSTPFLATGNSTYGIRANGTNWVTVGTNGKVAFSSNDGVSFSFVTSNAGINTLNDVAYGNGIWLAGGENNTLITSTDGVVWTLISGFILPSGTTIYSIVFGDGIFVINGCTSTSDAITFQTLSSTQGTHSFFANGMWMKTAFNSPNYIILEATTDLIFRYNSTIIPAAGGIYTSARPFIYYNNQWLYCTGFSKGYIMASP